MIPLASVAKGKKKEVDSRPLLQHNNLKHQRDIDEHKLKVFFYFRKYSRLNYKFSRLLITTNEFIRHH